jgi:hypothetical protein
MVAARAKMMTRMEKILRAHSGESTRLGMRSSTPSPRLPNLRRPLQWRDPSLASAQKLPLGCPEKALQPPLESGLAVGTMLDAFDVKH